MAPPHKYLALSVSSHLLEPCIFRNKILFVDPDSKHNKRTRKNTKARLSTKTHTEKTIKSKEFISTSDSDSEVEDRIIQDEDISDVEDDITDDENPTSHSIGQVVNQYCITSNSIITIPEDSIRGENTIWSTTRTQPSGMTSSKIKQYANEGPTQQHIVDPKDCFQQFITNEIIEEIVKWTNVEIIRKRKNIKKISSTYKVTCKEEIWALIGILTLTAVMKDNHLSVDELFDASLSGARYVAVMTMERFNYLMRCLRMADKSESKEDPFAPMRNVWNLFAKQCRLNYVPGTNLTVGEQFLRFRGKCPFRVHKAKKYGVKFPTICDASTKYMLDAVPFIGQSTKTSGERLGECFVKELTKSVRGSNRNVTCDSSFTSVPLAKSLLKNNVTLVGSVKSSNKEIPKDLKNSLSRPVGSSMVCYHGPLTLVSYKPKSTKMMYLLSSREEDSVLNEDSKMLKFYEQTKGVVESFSEMCSWMSCSRMTNRWSIAVFLGMLNMAFANCYIIYGLNVLIKEKKPLNRMCFMKKLSMDLTSSWMDARLEAPTLNRQVRENICNILQKTPINCKDMLSNEPELKKRKQCSFCSYKKRRMTTSFCRVCKKAVCGEHYVRVCLNCAAN